MKRTFSLALVAAAAMSTFTFAAPASANCIEIDGVGCYNPCSAVAAVYYKVTGRDMICTM